MKKNKKKVCLFHVIVFLPHLQIKNFFLVSITKIKQNKKNFLFDSCSFTYTKPSSFIVINTKKYIRLSSTFALFHSHLQYNSFLVTNIEKKTSLIHFTVPRSDLQLQLFFSDLNQERKNSLKQAFAFSLLLCSNQI